MKRLAAVGCVVLALGSLVGGVCLGQTTSSPKGTAKEKVVSKLAKVRQLTTGELAAIYVTQLVTAHNFVETPMIAAYNSEVDKVSIVLFGPTTTMDQAKTVIEEFREKALSPCLEALEAIYDLKLEEGDFKLEYFDTSKDKVFLEWADDEYKIH